MRSRTSSRRWCCRKRSASSCANVDVQRSVPCLARLMRCRIGCGAWIQPTRTPGEKILESGAEVDDAGGRVERAQRRQRLALEAQPAVGVVLDDQQVALLGERHHRRRRSTDIVTPAGFWKVGMT